jgi:hypothetical protein
MSSEAEVDGELVAKKVFIITLTTAVCFISAAFVVVFL